MSLRTIEPELLLSLLGQLVRCPRRRAELLGDLAEEHAVLAGATSPRRALFWLAGEAALLAVRLAPSVVCDLVSPPRYGNPTRPKEGLMGQLLFDLRLATRSLLRRPAATLVMVATLALGLGSNAAVFGVIEALLLRPYPFRDVDRMVAIHESGDGVDEFDRSNLSPAAFLDLQQQSTEVVEELVGFVGWGVNLRGPEASVKLDGGQVSTGFFSTLGLAPVRGRFFVAGDDAPSETPPVVLGHALWLRLYGGDDEILGQNVEIDGRGYTVVGVAPASLQFPTGAELWAPLVFTPEDAVRRDLNYVGAFGRLTQGTSLESAASRFTLLGEQLAQDHPLTNRGHRLVTATFSRTFQDPGLGPILVLWQGAAALVLLIAWANVTNLVLVRSSERQRELAMLDALGAGRLRLLRLQLAEGTIVAGTASLLSLPVAWVALRALRDNLPVPIRRFVAGWDELQLDLGTFAFVALLAAVTVLAIATWPAWKVSSTRLAADLRAAALGGTLARAGARGRSVLLVAEIAAALLIVILATVTLRGATRLLDGPQGFDMERQLVLKVALDDTRYAEPEARRGFARSALERLAELPGVESVALANALPATNDGASLRLTIEGAPAPDPANRPEVDARFVSPTYFETLGIRLLSGRPLVDSDDADAEPVAIVSRSMAERYWPGREPIGARFQAGDEDRPWVTVVGVAEDHIHQWFARRHYPTFFQPYAQRPSHLVAFAVRTSGDPYALAAPVQRALASLDPYQPAYDLRSLEDSHYAATIGLRYVSAILGVFAGLALVLAVSGVYTVLACRVALGMREACVRIALGAGRRQVLGATLGRTVGLAGIGIVLGLVAGGFAGRWLSGILRGSVAVDGRLLASAVAVLLIAAIAAAVVPTRRALAADPAAVLKDL